MSSVGTVVTSSALVTPEVETRSVRVSPKPARVLKPAVTGTAVVGSPRFNFGGARVECPQCGKSVYHAEQVCQRFDLYVFYFAELLHFVGSRRGKEVA